MEEFVRKFGLLTEDKPENAYLNKITPIEIQEYINNETPYSRLIAAFGKDQYGHWGPELKTLADGALHVGFITFFFANYFTGRQAHYRWHATNQISIFETRYKAMRAYMDFVFLRAMQQSAWTALKFTSFACLFIGGSKAVAVANNKSTITDYTAGGFLAGTVMKFNMGFRGCFVAGILGGVLGSLAGLIIYPLQKYSGLTEENYHRAFVATLLAQQHYYEDLVGAGGKILTAREERQQRRQERMAWLRQKFAAAKGETDEKEQIVE